MAVDYFLKLDGCPGESRDAKHPNEIQILSWSFGASQTGTMAFGGGGGAGKVSMQDFNFTQNMNKSTSALMLKCATGEHIKNAVMTARKAGKEQVDYLKITFTDVLVSSYSTGGSTDGGVPVESISLNFAEIAFEYKIQKDDGSLGEAYKMKYNLKEMQAK